MTLPTVADANDPVWQAWTQWRRDVLTKMIVAWDEDVKAIRPHASFIPNMSGASLMEFDLKLIEKHCPFIVVDDQGRRGTESLWMAGRNGKRVRATFRERPVILITSIGPEEEHRWKDAVTTGPEMAGWITNGTAHGMLPWFTKFNGVVPDTRWVEPVADAFVLHADLEPVLGAMTATAEIAIIDPSTTLRHWAPEMRKQAESDDLGFYQALVEAKLPFEFLSDQMMTPERLDAFKVVILANARCLSDAQCRMLEDYVARGGSVVAAFETSTRDENGKRARRLRRWRSVFGARLVVAGPRAGEEHLRRAERRRIRSTAAMTAPTGSWAARSSSASRRSTARRSPSSSCPTSPTCRWRRSTRARSRAAAPSSPARPPAGAPSISRGTSAASSGKCSPPTTAG